MQRDGSGVRHVEARERSAGRYGDEHIACLLRKLAQTFALRSEDQSCQTRERLAFELRIL
jgi:hypothetical protein